MNKFKVGSLYAGVGGICLGFKQAGFELEWANELDINANITYENNFKHKLLNGSVFDINDRDLSEIDILTAGFPCQPFSIAGYRKGFLDIRGNHFLKIIQLANLLEPKVLFLENVKNLVTHDNGNTFRIILKTLKEIGYLACYKIMNSKEYANIPQNRERIYIVAFKIDTNENDNIYSQFLFPKPKPLTNSIHDFIDSTVDNESFFYRESWQHYLELSNGILSKDTIYQWRRQYVRENKQNVCPTLTANMGTGGHNVPIILTKTGIRKLSPRECFRFQGFPEDFILPSISNTQLYKQAGNSVTVPIIRSIANNIGKFLKEKNDAKIPFEQELVFN